MRAVKVVVSCWVVTAILVFPMISAEQGSPIPAVIWGLVCLCGIITGSVHLYLRYEDRRVQRGLGSNGIMGLLGDAAVDREWVRQAAIVVFLGAAVVSFFHSRWAQIAILFSLVGGLVTFMSLSLFDLWVRRQVAADNEKREA